MAASVQPSPVPTATDRMAMTNQFPRVSGWCLAPWKGSLYSGATIELKEDQALVRIFDAEGSLQWPVEWFPISALKPFASDKHSNLQDLIASLKSNGILRTPSIEEAFLSVDRGHFCWENPYWDAASDVGCGMIISSPHIHVLALEACEKWFGNATAILDVGSGSGHVTALFAKLAPNAQVTGVEYFQELVERSQKRVDDHFPDLKSRITLLNGNGLKGCEERAPYNIIYVGFMCKEVPQELIDQLAPDGILLIPVGNAPSRHNPAWLTGEVLAIKKLADGTLEKHALLTCSFVPAME